MKRLKITIFVIVFTIFAVGLAVAVLYGSVAGVTVFFLLAAIASAAAGGVLFHLAVVRQSNKAIVFTAPHNAIAPEESPKAPRHAIAPEESPKAPHNAIAPEESPKAPRHALAPEESPQASHNVVATEDLPVTPFPGEEPEKLTTEELSITAADGLRLCATLIRNQPGTRRLAVLCHGYGCSGEDMMFAARFFHEKGYGVLMPDARGHGKSAGNYLGMGWPDRKDIIQWLNEIGTGCGADEIVLYGISMGAATVLMVSGEELPETVKAVVADCGYTSAKAEFTYQLKMLFGLPAFPVIPVASLITRIFAGYWLGECSALRQIAKSKTPVLLIHGSADTFVPAAMMAELYDAAVCPKQKMLVAGAGHGRASAVDSVGYWQTVADFLAKQR